ncbi:MAG: sulfurtransferase complex subunit TusB [Halobacteriota archaeon]|nr:sulfurtransferase complex subunit TusB [Halobacteriota archaeon]
MKSIIFVILKTPSEGDPTDLASTLAGDNKRSFMLLEDGVYWAISDERRRILKDQNAEIFAANDDLLARGYDCEIEDVKRLDYEGIVEVLMEEYDQIITL